jgi:hypothetical protein
MFIFGSHIVYPSIPKQRISLSGMLPLLTQKSRSFYFGVPYPFGRSTAGMMHVLPLCWASRTLLAGISSGHWCGHIISSTHHLMGACLHCLQKDHVDFIHFGVPVSLWWAYRRYACSLWASRVFVGISSGHWWSYHPSTHRPITVWVLACIAYNKKSSYV